MKRKTGIIYHDDFLLHDTRTHPECKERLIFIRKKLEQLGLWEQAQIIAPKSVTKDILTYVHPVEYTDYLFAFSNNGGGRLDPDTVMSTQSYEVALLAAGGAVIGLEQVVNRQLDNCFVMVRPPGHHAEPKNGMGFCLLNNVAIAASYAQRELGIKKIIIVDIDAHHGNGTEKIFYDDAGVLYFSIHQSPLFPGTGLLNSSGSEVGAGYNINVPVPRGTGDQAFLYTFQKLLLPVIKQYQPELIIVSAGFDGYYQDPLAGLELTCTGFEKMAEQLLEISEEVCQGRLVTCLEGGYSLPDIGKPVAAMVATLLGQSLPDSFYSNDLIENHFLPAQQLAIDGAIDWQRQFWKL